MRVRVTGVTVDQPLPVGIAAVTAVCAEAFGVHLPSDECRLDGMPCAVDAELPLCVDALLRSGRHLLTVVHDGEGHWSARLLTLPSM